MLTVVCTLRSYSRDINGYTKANNSLDPINIYRGHTSIVEVRPSRSSAVSPSLGLTSASTFT